MSFSEIFLYDPKQPRVPAGSENGGEWVGNNKENEHVTVVLNKKDGFGTDVFVGENGKIIINWPGFGESQGALRDKVQSAVLDKFRPKNEPGIFWRFTNNKNEPLLASNGDLRPSKNHADGSIEQGLSVSEGAHYSAQGYKYGYQVSGSVIGIGSDGEPLLDVHSIRPVSKIFTSEKISQMDRSRRLELLNKHGWSETQMKNVVNGKFEIR